MLSKSLSKYNKDDGLWSLSVSLEASSIDITSLIFDPQFNQMMRSCTVSLLFYSLSLLNQLVFVATDTKTEVTTSVVDYMQSSMEPPDNELSSIRTTSSLNDRHLTIMLFWVI